MKILLRLHPWDSPKGAARSLLPLERRWPEGPDEGAFVGPNTGVAPHQFGRMTYGCAIEGRFAAPEENAAVSHGLTSSPPRGEGKPAVWGMRGEQ
jgi:hypothetical protein